jgi:hypothetical protein
MSLPQNQYDPYHYLNTTRTPTVSQLDISRVRTEPQFGLDNVVYVNTPGYATEEFNIEETVRRLSLVNDPTQVLVLWAAENHTGLTEYSLTRLNTFARSIPNRIVYFTGVLGPVPMADFDIVPVMNFEKEAHNQLQRYDVKLDLPPAERQRKFMFMSLKDHAERRLLMSRIVRSGQIDQGYVSYRKLVVGDLPNVYSAEQKHSILSEGNLVDQMAPVHLPGDDPQADWTRRPRHFLSDSYLNMVTDTYFIVEPGNTFISEKVFNAVANWQLFIMLSPPGTLSWLHSQGYQTFGHWIDERYDSIEDNYTRLIAVADVFEDFIRRPIKEIQQTHAEAASVLNHNYQRLLNNQFTNTIQQAIDKARL